jgi:putative hydrolase of the HAD superfamily
MSKFWLVTDADNTLWDTNRVFADAQLEMLAATERAANSSVDQPDRLAFVRKLDQHLAQSDHRGLKYPPAFLVKAIWSALPSDKAAADDASLEDIVHRYLEMLGAHPQLRPGVLETLTQLKTAGVTICVLSEGKRERVLKSIADHGLDAYVTQIVTGEKTADMFRRIKRLGGPGASLVCVGDQLDRDVAFAKEAGLFAVFFPGGFTPGWIKESRLPQPDLTIDDFRQLIPLFGQTAA